MNKFIIYDAVYNEIVINEPLFQKLIFVPEFQRLKNIHQLGLLMFVRSSTRHTRYSHSLGVFWLLELLFQQPSFAHLSPTEKMEIKAAGLLHDVGHGPFSHNFEKIMPKFVHEQYSVDFIRNPNGAILPLLKKYQLNVERICNLIQGKTKNDWAQTLISGQFDLDRLDYMMRDQHFTGSGVELIDHKTLLTNIILHKNQIVFALTALKHVESYLLFRFYLYKELFWNTKNLLLEHSLFMIFERIRYLKKNNMMLKVDYSNLSFLVEQKLPNLNELIILSDSDLFMFLKNIFYQETDWILRTLSSLFINPQKHYDLYVGTTPDVFRDLIPISVQKYFTYKTKQSITVYNPLDKEISFIDKEGKILPLSKISLFFKHPKNYSHRVTLYVNLIGVMQSGFNKKV